MGRTTYGALRAVDGLISEEKMPVAAPTRSTCALAQMCPKRRYISDNLEAVLTMLSRR